MILGVVVQLVLAASSLISILWHRVGLGGHWDGKWELGDGRYASLDYNERYNKASMSTTHDVVNVSQDTTRQDMYLVGSELCGVCSSAYGSRF
jgi:hypothetical protein